MEGLLNRSASAKVAGLVECEEKKEPSPELPAALGQYRKKEWPI